MKLTPAHIIEAIVALVICVALYFQYTDAREVRAQLQATIAQQNAVIAQQQEQTKQLEQSIASRDQAAQAQLAALQSQISSLQSPSQIVPWLANTLNKQVPQQITISTPEPTKGSTAPAPVTATIPQEDLASIRDLLANAQQCKVQLTACSADRTDLEKVVTAKDAEIKSVTAEKDAAVKAAKGGSWLHRTLKVVKYVGIGLGVGVALGASHAL